MKRYGYSSTAIKYTLSTLFAVFTFSTYISYNRDTLALLYYMIGYILPVIFAGVALLLLCTNRFSEKIRRRMTMSLIGLFIAMIVYTETRISAINILMLLMLATPIFWRGKPGEKTDKIILAAYTLTIIPTTLLSHYRLMYFSFPRGAINFSVSGDLLAVVMNTIIACLGIIIYLRSNKLITNTMLRNAIIGLFTSIPFLMYQESNTIDWILLTGLIICVFAGIFLKVRQLDKGYEIITMVTFCWLTMSWGGYVGGITMTLYVAIKSFINHELAFLTIKNTDITKEVPRIMIVTILPLVAWFTWWAALGQIGGFSSPRDVDPGLLYLNGGYIGDRFSPSNSWVGFMGGGPAAAMSLLWWSMFHSNGYNMNYVAYYLIARIGMLSLQLSLSPNLPRLIFKLSWDIIFSIGLLGFMMHLVIQSRIENKHPEKSIPTPDI